jgi:hypothetical protein
MKARNRFGAGGCYTCTCCKRKTRSTGRGDNENCGLCEQCFGAAALENEMSDSGFTPELMAQWQSLIDECKALGGKPDEDVWWL